MMAADTSALVAVLNNEPEGDTFLHTMVVDGDVLVSIATAVELMIVAMGKGDAIYQAAVELLDRPFIQLVPLDEAQLWAAVDAHRVYGKGRHPAGLNLGDTFAYALASVRNLPLLYKGNDFARTDIIRAASAG